MKEAAPVALRNRCPQWPLLDSNNNIANIPPFNSVLKDGGCGRVLSTAVLALREDSRGMAQQYLCYHSTCLIHPGPAACQCSTAASPGKPEWYNGKSFGLESVLPKAESPLCHRSWLGTLASCTSFAYSNSQGCWEDKKGNEKWKLLVSHCGDK